MKIQDSLLEDRDKYKEYSERWFQLYLFICALISNVVFGFSLSPIVKDISIIYHINVNWLQLLVISFTISSAVMILPGNILSEKYGIRSNIALGCGLTLIGAIFALFVHLSFWFVYVGQVVSLIGFPFRLISASKFTANWFMPHSRIFIMVIIALTFNASSGFSIKIPYWIFGDYETSKDDENYSQGKRNAENLIYFLSSIVMALTIPPLIFFKSKPPTPPSFTASDQCKRENYVEAGKDLMQNRDFKYLSLAFPFLLGSVVLLTLQLELVVKPIGFSLEDISNCVTLGVIAGLTGDLSVGYIVKKTGQYRNTLRLCNLLVTIFFITLIICFIIEFKWGFFFFYALVCGTSSVMAITFELACEISFPVSENSTIAFLGLIGNLINFSQGLPEIFVLSVDSKTASLMTLFIMLTFISIGNWLSYKINENLKRLHIDEKKEAISSNSLQTI